MFQDEARFGRISQSKRCWCPKPVRPVCPTMVCQEYTYAYGAVSIADGQWNSLILPNTNSVCMQIFLEEIALRYPGDRIMTLPLRRLTAGTSRFLKGYRGHGYSCRLEPAPCLWVRKQPGLGL